MSSNHWLLIQSGLCPCDFNMALDEALLEAMPRLDRPVLRFYGWLQPAATFGYFQKFAEVERSTQLRPLIRRPTGGGIVPHARDWTYSLAFPPTREWYAVAATESYRRVHEWLKAAFSLLGVATTLAATPQKVRAGQCFVGFEQFDLLWNEQKIAGAAQRRRQDGLLIQGSVQPPAISLDRADWERAMCEAAVMQHHVSWSVFSPDELLANRAAALAREKYSRTDYNRKR
jgi:lipoyl(octanoyl) transferase